MRATTAAATPAMSARRASGPCGSGSWGRELGALDGAGFGRVPAGGVNNASTGDGSSGSKRGEGRFDFGSYVPNSTVLAHRGADADERRAGR